MKIPAMQNIDPVKSLITAISSAATGTLLNAFPLALVTVAQVGIILQYGAWIIAILAGLVSIINGVRKWFCKPTADPRELE